MPAFGDPSDNDVESWKLVTFIRHLPKLTTAEQTEMESLNPKSPEEFKEEQEEAQFLNSGYSPAANVTPHHLKGNANEKLLLLVLTFGLFAAAAYAHNGMEHVMGTVTAMTDSSISVKTTKGTIQTVAFTGDTKFLKGDAAISTKEIKIGDHIVIHATKKEGKLIAAEVKVGAMKGMHGEMPGMNMSGSKRHLISFGSAPRHPCGAGTQQESLC